MVIGLVGHPNKLRLIEEIITQSDSSLEIQKLEFSEIATEAHIASYMILQEAADIMVLGGYYDYLYFCNRIVFNKTTGYIPRDITTLMRSLLEAKLSNYDIFNLSIDGFTEKELTETYREIGYDINDIHVYSWYKNLPLSPDAIEDTFLFHEYNYRERNVSVCMTCISTVYERLCQANIPTAMINTTAENVRIAYEKLHLEYLLRRKESSDIALMDITIVSDRTAVTEKDEYLLNAEKLHIAELVFLFTQKLQAAVEALNLDHYLIICSKLALEEETNLFKQISLMEDMSQFHHCRLCIGIGYGLSMREIQHNSQFARQKAHTQKKSCTYVVYDSVNMIGPLFSDQLDNMSLVQDINSQIAKKTGLGVNTIQKLRFIIERYKSNMFTVNELSLIYGISLRSMYRIVDKLVVCGYAQERGKQPSNGAGRPRRIIQIDFEQKSNKKGCRESL